LLFTPLWVCAKAIPLLIWPDSLEAPLSGKTKYVSQQHDAEWLSVHYQLSAAGTTQRSPEFSSPMVTPRSSSSDNRGLTRRPLCVYEHIALPQRSPLHHNRFVAYRAVALEVGIFMSQGCPEKLSSCWGDGQSKNRRLGKMIEPVGLFQFRVEDDLEFLSSDY